MIQLPPGPSRQRSVPEASGSATLTPIRCLLVDDHPAIRVGLRELLAGEAEFEVLEAVASAEAAVAFAERAEVDVAVVDYQLPERSGLWASRKLKRLHRPPAVLIYSAFSDYFLAAACVVAEADGLVSKAALGSELCDRIREVSRGVTRLPLVPPSFADSMRRRLDSEEQAIFGMLLAGIKPDEIASTLGRSRGGLESRLWAMLRKLQRPEAG
ncbi:MAG TPA: response regulator transcription factor [Solirubrobacteraceae bacterium]|jgi:DNA-binding NarL/FixJ family response regulator